MFLKLNQEVSGARVPHSVQKTVPSCRGFPQLRHRLSAETDIAFLADSDMRSVDTTGECSVPLDMVELSSS